MIVRYGYAAPGKTQIDIGTGFSHGWRNETERSPDVVFDDKNAQAVPPPRNQECRNSGWHDHHDNASRRRVATMLVGEAKTPEGMRLYAIGDIHGCDDELAEVHAQVATDLATRPVADHRIIHIGDYVDRGPDSAAVIERLVRLKREDKRTIFLRGNHDERLMAFLADPTVGEMYLSPNIGGSETLASYGVAAGTDPLAGSYAALSTALARAMPPAHRRFLSDLELTIRSGDYLFVHAGIRPGVPLDAQDPEDLIWIREEFLDDRRDHGVVVVHGHTIVTSPEVLPNRINIDTGAVFGGPLTCLVLEGRDYRFL